MCVYVYTKFRPKLRRNVHIDNHYYKIQHILYCVYIMSILYKCVFSMKIIQGFDRKTYDEIT